jgi:ATP-dependent helicase/nuclease subunit A
MSVSEIKHMEMEKYKEDESALPEETNAPEEVIPEEVIAEMTGKAALRGTITHAIFENLDYGNVVSKESLKFEMERALSELHFKDEEKELVKTDYLLKFYSEDEGSLFQMMRKAFTEGKLYRERQFIAGLRPDEIPGVGAKVELSAEDGHIRDITKDYIMIQGIIDAYFYQGPDDDIILVDYKTDNVESGEELLGRYAAQMYLYALTLEKLTGHKVKDIILYSTRLGEIHYNNWREYKL